MPHWMTNINSFQKKTQYNLNADVDGNMVFNNQLAMILEQHTNYILKFYNRFIMIHNGIFSYLQ